MTPQPEKKTKKNHTVHLKSRTDIHSNIVIFDQLFYVYNNFVVYTFQEKPLLKII